MSDKIELAAPRIDFDAVKSFCELFPVTTSDQYLLASNELITLKKKRNEVVEFFAEMKSSAYATWKVIVAREKFFTDKIDQFETILKKKMLSFKTEQDRIQRETQMRLQAEANVKADAERKKLLANAKQNERRGNELNAEMYKNAAENVTAPAVVIENTTPKAAGISTREVWKAEVTDKQAFIAAVAANPGLLQFIQVDCAGMVRQGWRECSGVRFWKEAVLSARG